MFPEEVGKRQKKAGIGNDAGLFSFGCHAGLPTDGSQ